MSRIVDYFSRLGRLVLASLRTLRPKRAASLNQCKMVLDWIVSQDLPQSTAGEFQLPVGLAGFSARGVVQAIHTADGRYCLLLKTHIGWKGNFEGTLYCDKPLRPVEIVEKPGGRTYISIEGRPPFEELYVRRQRSDRWYDVYFDLN